MAAAVAGLAAHGTTQVAGFEAVDTSYPGFADSSRRAHRGRAEVGTVTVTPRSVAIDGPAGAGKSTLAQAVAEHLGLERLDTGAMYRAVAWSALRRGIDPADDDAVARARPASRPSRWASG